MAEIGPRWRPDSLKEIHPELGEQLDFAIRQAYENQNNAENIAVTNAAGSALKLASGTSTVTGSLVGIPTGLSTVSLIVGAVIIGSSALNERVSAVVSTSLTGAIELFVWKPTASGDSTPIASTTVRTVQWIALGT